MEENLEILDNWFVSFENYKRISFKEAQNLCREILQAPVEEIKRKKDELLLGTMYVIYANIKKSLLIYLPSNKCDIEDIIHTGIMIWMEFINEGKLLNYSSYVFLERDFFRKISQFLLCSEAFSKNFSYFSYFGVEKQHFLSCLVEYVLVRRKKTSISFSQFLEMFKEYPMLASFYSFFEEVYSLFEGTFLFDKEENFSKRQILFSLPYLMEELLYSTYNIKNPKSSFLAIGSPMEDVGRDELICQIRDVYEVLDLPSIRNKKMVADFFGLHGERKTLLNLSEEYRMSKQAVHRNIEKTLKHIRKKNSYSRELKEFYQGLE